MQKKKTRETDEGEKQLKDVSNRKVEPQWVNASGNALGSFDCCVDCCVCLLFVFGRF